MTRVVLTASMVRVGRVRGVREVSLASPVRVVAAPFAGTAVH